MIRTFETHKIRFQKELSGRLWGFSPLEGEHVGETYQVPVPSCWETYPEFVSYRGEGMYRTSFLAGGNVRLEFKGVSHTSTVYLDGKEIAAHYNAYSIFSTIVKNVYEGEHLLEVKADNRFSKDSSLHIPNDYMSYGGISRPVALETVSDVYIQWVHFTPIEDNGWKGKIEVCLANISGNEHVVSIASELGNVNCTFPETTIQANSSVTITDIFTFPDAKSWMQETPTLYLLNTVLSENNVPIDDMIERVGFRVVEIEGKKIFFNKKQLRIKGFCRHEDHPSFGCSLPYEAIAYDLQLAQNLGGNSLRTSHYPNDEIFLDLCDEMGILVWEENHARGLSEEQMRNPNFQKQCEDVITEMIPAHYNHPSIYIWGILNECASETEYGKECYEKQFAQIKELDTSRPRSFASCKFKTDLCFGYPEVVSYNIYPQWYHDIPVADYLSDLYDWVQNETEGTGKPFLITEIGAGAIYGYRTPTLDKWSEEYQAKALEEQITAVLSQPGCSGIYIWQFCDVRISKEWFNNRPRSMNNKGIVDEYRRRKLSYDTVKRLFSSVSNYIEE